jgi:hypothetical protein
LEYFFGFGSLFLASINTVPGFMCPSLPQLFTFLQSTYSNSAESEERKKERKKEGPHDLVSFSLIGDCLVSRR